MQIQVHIPQGLPTIPWATLKAEFEPNQLKAGARDVSKLKDSIVKNGFKIPLFVWMDGKFITDGAGRFKALTELEAEGYEIPDLPYVPIQAKDKQEAKSVTLMVSSQYGHVTEESFAEFVLDMEGIDLDFVQVPMTEIVATGEKPEIVEDEVPEPPAEPKAKRGDIYQLGRHRLMCGDATSEEDVKNLVGGGAFIDLFLTDPPYNVAYVGKTKDALTIKNDAMDDGKFREFLRAAYKAADSVLKEGGAFYIWHADSEGFNFRGAAKDIGWTVRQCLIWVKNSLVLGRQDYQWKHEPSLYGWKDGAAHTWASDRKQTTVLEFDRPSRSGEHPTMKPIALIAYQIQNSSREGENVLDTFGGSGTTLIACEQTGRVGFSMELDPKYVDVQIARWEAFTGQKAEKIAGG
jgi:DNA modification methylase